MLMIAGCSSSGAEGTSSENGPDGSEPGRAVAALVSLRSCSEVQQAVRSAAVRAMSDLLEEQRDAARSALEEGSCWYGSYYYGLEDGAMLMAGGMAVPASNMATSAAPSANTGAAAPSEVSETNNQVAGVDEADFIKNDADGYICVLADGALQILAAWPADESRVIAQVPLADTPRRIFVHNGRLLIFSSVARTSAETAEYQSWWHSNSEECTHGDDCDFTGDGQKTRLSIYDISDRTAPVQIRTIDTSATFISARRIGSRPGASYASGDSYYVSVRQYPNAGSWFMGWEDVEEASTVHKFALAAASNQYRASGVVKGRVLNQFSMDEYEAHLRIATTTGHVPNPEVHTPIPSCSVRCSWKTTRTQCPASASRSTTSTRSPRT
jgi:uncharacterized secreted protein with C-terminal beta-propeller domain